MLIQSAIALIRKRSKSIIDYLWHLDLAEFVPQILNCVESNESRAKKPNPFHTADTTNANAGKEEPQEPFWAETLLLESVKSSPAQHSCKCEAQKHGIQKNESADRGIGIFAKNHQSDEPNGRSFEVQFAGSVVGERDADGTKKGVERPHEGVVELIRILLSRLEFE